VASSKLHPAPEPGAKPSQAPVLVFGRWRLPMTAADAKRLEAVIAAHQEHHGSTFGLVGRLLDGELL
jgi:hypothetical protein